MPMDERFPPELLGHSKKQRLAYFDNKVIAHPILKDIFEDTFSRVCQPAGSSLIYIYGPTGVGKSTLCHRLLKRTYEEDNQRTEDEPDYIPAVQVEAKSPEQGNFSWRDYYRRLLTRLKEPLIDHKLCYEEGRIRLGANGQPVAPKNSQVSDLRYALESCLEHRKPRAIITDEAQHLSKMSSGRRLLDQMDALKSFTSMTGTLNVLVGTYELLDLMRLNGQLARRAKHIHFRRYRPDLADDVKAFKGVLYTFQRHLPIAETPDLVGYYEYLYEGSAGCVGILKNWLLRALASAMEKGQEKITLKILEQQAEEGSSLAKIAEEIRQGEERLALSENERKKVRWWLGMESDAKQSEQFTQLPISSPNRQPKAFVRKPKRDKVGVTSPNS